MKNGDVLAHFEELNPKHPGGKTLAIIHVNNDALYKYDPKGVVLVIRAANVFQQSDQVISIPRTAILFVH